MSFDESAREYILTLFNKKIVDGKVFEKDSDEVVMSFEGNQLSVDEFGGVKKGSEIFIEDNIVSLIKLKSKKE
ncbi:MAG: hypothetical protein M1481_07310 [Candidatus Thermoplasmatota archaeon]|jgi:hypothetical protein|nr:hypothetical protein [Candidatus Thermoplasmatota archaeon]MCL5963949.1 hypothetical protein [Candidatus Thermoplasmatota archaeon]